MTALEIILLLIGIICVAGSFVLMNKLDGSDGQGAVVNTTLTDKQKEDIKSQIAKVFDDQMESLTADISDKTEVSLEKLSNQKIKELSEYSDTVLAEINKNHSEVMFLYDMLIEKNKEVHNTIKDINTAMSQQPATQQVVVEKIVEVPVEVPVEAVAAPIEEEPKKAAPKKRTRTTKVTEEAEDATPAKKRTTRKKAETPAPEEPVVEAAAVAEDDLELPDDMEFLTGANKNKAILDLHNAGKSNVAIAKELGLGTGEVKLVIDLFKGQK